jgi:spore coat polysaccharide biosynthesis predicted glycosyltransferase SpsG
MRVGIFASAGKGIGYGHYARCRSLADGFAERNKEADLFIYGDFDISLAGAGCQSRNWLANLPSGYDICVVDSYLTTERDLQRIAGNNGLCVFIDDDMRLDYPSGILLNSSIHAGELPYPDKPGQLLLTGCRYALLRKPLWDFDDYSDKTEGGIFLSAGGSGMEDVLKKICGLLLENTDEKIKVISREKPVDSMRVESRFGLSAQEMANLMASCSFAVSAAGQTTYELARLAVSPVLFGLAENQLGNLEGWAKTGFALSAGFYGEKNFEHKMKRAIENISDSDNRFTMASLGPLYVDGQGARRVSGIISEVKK